MERGGRHNPNGLWCDGEATVSAATSCSGAGMIAVSTEMNAMPTVTQDLHSAPALQGDDLPVPLWDPDCACAGSQQSRWPGTEAPCA